MDCNSAIQLENKHEITHMLHSLNEILNISTKKLRNHTIKQSECGWSSIVDHLDVHFEPGRNYTKQFVNDNIHKGKTIQ